MCLGGRHRSGSVFFESHITETGQKLTIIKCAQRNRKKSRTVIDNIRQAKGLTDFFLSLPRSSSKAAKK